MWERRSPERLTERPAFRDQEWLKFKEKKEIRLEKQREGQALEGTTQGTLLQTCYADTEKLYAVEGYNRLVFLEKNGFLFLIFCYLGVLVLLTRSGGWMDRHDEINTRELRTKGQTDLEGRFSSLQYLNFIIIIFFRQVSLYSKQGWSWTRKSSCLCLPGAEVKGMWYHA